MKTDDGEQTRRAIAAYSGPVRRCRPGTARAKGVKIVDEAAMFLSRHRDDVPVRDAKAERRQMRMVRARAQRIADRNEAIRKARGV
jgi:hypothetical protein